MLSRSHHAGVLSNPDQLFFKIAPQFSQKVYLRFRFQKLAERQVSQMDKAREPLNGAGDSHRGCDVWPVEKNVASNGLSGISVAVEHILQVIDHLVPETPVQADSLKEFNLPL